ncbi:YaaL family protein [Alkalicoccus chagannorensis]|uniref:YaaL family protein n=1 Tax=Alkalicoccus chagannorensis TaxID=427072 RepID=UPI0012ECB5D9|nr:YaaL family protein [Alkalicoccus chagannorensis]
MRGKKRKLRRETDRRLIEQMERIKQKADQHERYLAQSVDANIDLIGRTRMERAKFWMLLKEARHRGTTFY